MNVEVLREYCLAKKHVTEGFPFDEETLVFKVMGKIFAIIPLERQPLQINLKCEPETAILLRERHDGIILPGYHMNKRHWNTVLVERLAPKNVEELVDVSYGLVVQKLPKKLKETYSDT